MRTLIYARYSSQLQNARSIADQLAACRARADREGWPVLGAFHDQAISGAAGIEEAQRPGLAAMLARVEAGGIDQVLTESTDRIARHQGDGFAVRERLQFAGARLFTLLDGEVDDITGTIKGLFDARMRKDLAHRVRRGHRGNIAEGRAAGSIAYGYRRLARFDAEGEAIRGLRELDPDTAPIVERIFREYASGLSALKIAERLNADGIPPPRRGIWRASTLIAHRQQSFGILANPIYVGRLLYGRTRQVVDPRTRQRRTRIGNCEAFEGAAEHLRIIPDDLWHAVQAQLQQRSTTRPERQRRPKHVLSGLGVCGVCGQPWIIRSQDFWGCSGHIGGKACSNNRLIKTHLYERRVLAELKAQLLAPDSVSEYLGEYYREHARQVAEIGRDRRGLDRRLDEAKRKVARLINAVAAGGSEFAEIRELLAAARDDRDRCQRELAALDALPVLTLHPGLADQYRRSIEALEQDLAADETRLEAVPRLRKLIARIKLFPRTDRRRGVDLHVVRHIDEALAIASADRKIA